MDYGYAAWMGILGVFFFVLLAIGVIFYVLKSIGLATLAANRGIENSWLAWIPIADLYIMGLLLGEMDFFGYRITNLGLWFPVVIVVGSFLADMHYIGWLFSLALLVFGIMFIYKLFSMYTDQALLYTLLSTLLGLLPVFLFLIRNNKQIYLAGTPPAP